MNPLKYLVLRLILLYRSYISPLKPPSCRFHPTCSAYAYEAISRHGLAKGAVLSVKRLAKCHPFHGDKTMMCDPVPEEKKG